MSDERSELTRRTVLGAVGGSLAASGAAGLAGAAGEELLRVNVGYSAASGRRAALDAAAEVVHDFSFDALTVRSTASAAEALDGRPDLRYVEEDGAGHVFGQSLPWGVDRVDAERLHDNGESGDGAHVAILDTGIDSDHPDLEANLGAGKAVVSCSGTCSEPWDDDHTESHGTHVAGIAGAVDNGEGVVGVGAGATLHAVKVCDDGGDCRPGDAAAGLDWVAGRGYDVANVSFGFPHSDCVEDAVEAADGAGVLLVAATGKSGCDDCVMHPAAEPEVLAVTATDPNDDVTDYSNTGPEVALTAPGGADDGDPDTSILSTVRGGYDTLWGTSMAAPHVSGAGALYMAAGVSKAETRDRLLSDAEDVGHPADEQGSGLLDAYRGFPYLEVETDAAFPGTSTTTLRGDLADLAFTDSAECYFEYKRSVDSVYSQSGSVTRTSEGLYEVDIATTTDTSYDFRAVAEFSDGSVRRGDVLTFRTPEDDGGGTE